MSRSPATAALLLLLAACTGSGPSLVAENVEITRPLPGSGMSAAYLELHNSSPEEIRITRVVSPEFAAVELHESLVEDGVARMRPLDSLVVPARGMLLLARGGKHLMLHGAAPAPDTVSLQFYADGELLLTVTAPVGD